MTMFVLSPSVDDHGGVRLAEVRALEHAHVHPVTHDEPTAPAGTEPREGILVLVDRGDVPALGGETLRHGGADPATSDDDRVHGS